MSCFAYFLVRSRDHCINGNNGCVGGSVDCDVDCGVDCGGDCGVDCGVCGSNDCGVCGSVCGSEFDFDFCLFMFCL